MESKNKWFIGTCGWSYNPDWVNVFYPSSLSPKYYLDFYSQIFNTVEIDSSFYFTPKASSVHSWANSTPDYFHFSSKLNKEITHKHKLNLKKCQADLDHYFHSFVPMEQKNKQLAHLIQVPPSFNRDDHFFDLESFLNYWSEWRESEGKQILNSSYRENSWQPVVEFRHKSWLKPIVFDLLREHRVGFCAVVEPLLPPHFEITVPDLFYLRFHGYGSKPWWNYQFSDEELETWAKKVLNIAEKNPKCTIINYFNNHFSGYAVKNALDLLPKVGQKPRNPMEKVKNKFMKHQLSLKKHIRKNRSSAKSNPNQNSLDQWFHKKGDK